MNTLNIFALSTLVFINTTGAQAEPTETPLSKQDNFECGGQKIELISMCTNETIDETENQPGIPVCTDQFIKIGNNEIRRDIAKITQLTSNKRKVTMLSNVIVSLGCITGKKGSALAVGGYGGCNSCPEWYGYYSLTGELINYSYSNTFRSFGAKGTNNDLIKKYAIKKNIIEAQDYPHKNIKYVK